MSEKIEVQSALSKKAYAFCLEIRRKVFIEGMGIPEEIEVDTYEKESHHFLAFYEGNPVATGRYRLEKGMAKFERIATLVEFRGKGIASKLMKAMQEDVLKKYPDHLPTMHAQVSAVPFYLKLGWITVGPVFKEAEIDHQVMVLSHQSIVRE